MWRIFGLIFFLDKEHFLLPGKKAFNKEEIIRFLREKGVALYDTASAVCRLQDNASDKFLEIVEPTDIGLLLKQLPHCPGQSLLQGKKRPTPFVSIYKSKSLLWAEKVCFYTKDENMLYIACLLPAELIR